MLDCAARQPVAVRPATRNFPSAPKASAVATPIGLATVRVEQPLPKEGSGLPSELKRLTQNEILSGTISLSRGRVGSGATTFSFVRSKPAVTSLPSPCRVAATAPPPSLPGRND